TRRSSDLTSPKGAAVRDVVRILTRRFPNVHLMVFPVRVQGEGSAEEIVRALKFFNKGKLVDVLILARGGGSLEDLWSFNEEIVARAIFASEIPVISGVGHETDFTIADFVADVRASTPSAAAELVVQTRSEFDKHIADLGLRAERFLRVKRERWQRLTLQLQERGPLKVLERGYAIATDANGILLRDAAQVALGDSVAIQLHRGKLTTEVRKKEV